MTKIISKDGYKSYHKTAKAAADIYGWNYRKFMREIKLKGNFEGYTMEEMQQGVSIPCQILIEQLSWGWNQHNDFDSSKDGLQSVIFKIADKGIYTVIAEVNNTISMAEVGTDVNGFDLEVDDGEVVIELISHVYDFDANEIILDPETERILIENLDL